MKKQVKIKVCPECNSHLFNYDEYHLELYCKLCGLVLKAPSSTDFTTPVLKTIQITINVAEEVEVVKS